ncbi:MAG: hypothetical protein HYX53_03940 [Chloroflexi bacterium]|nr:hypothetical protein [Chloroflexota bacterium]
MSQVLELLSLQSVDDEAAALRAALADVERRLHDNEELDESRRELVAVRAKAELSRREQRRLEGEVEQLSDRIATDEKRLYEGSIRLPKELANLQHEVDLLKGARAKLEDELIEVLDTGEGISREVRGAENRVRLLEARWQQVQQDLRHESLRLNDAIGRADAKRDIQKSKINPRALQVYDEVRRRKGGMAVARIVGGSCTGCRVAIPDSLRRKAFSATELARCPNCERILALG